MPNLFHLEVPKQIGEAVLGVMHMAELVWQHMESGFSCFSLFLPGISGGRYIRQLLISRLSQKYHVHSAEVNQHFIGTIGTDS